MSMEYNIQNIVKMEETRESVKSSFNGGEERKPYGRTIRPPIELFAINLERPMYPLMIHLCFFCQKQSSEKDVFETNVGRIYLHVQLCSRCVEYNRSSQEAGREVLQKYAIREAEDRAMGRSEL